MALLEWKFTTCNNYCLLKPLADLNVTQKEFGKYDCFRPKPGESPQGTLIWEFGKSVAKYADRTSVQDGSGEPCAGPGSCEAAEGHREG